MENKDTKKYEYTSQLHVISGIVLHEGDDVVLRPAKGHYDKYDRIYLTDTSIDEDGVWKRVADFKKFAHKLESYDMSAAQNFIVGRKKKSDWGECVLHKVDDDKLKIVFKEPVRVYFGMIGDEPVV